MPGKPITAVPKVVPYKFQTKPFAHQLKCFKLSRDRKAFAFLMEQGTGKTKVGIDTAGYLYEAGKIDALVVLAPNEGDVPQVWVEQLPIHLPARIKHIAVRASNQGMRAAEKKTLAFMLDSATPLGLRVISTNIEAIRSGAPLFKTLLTFMRTWRNLLIIDESTRIKTMSAAQTKAAIKLGMNADYKRIASGTPITNGPFDAYSQFYFLDPAILGFDSQVAFKAHYCQMLPPEHGLVRYSAGKMAGKIQDPARRQAFADKMASIIQMPARNALGQIVYRNTKELAARIAPHSFRVLKEECLDLPPKLYVKRYVELTKRQREIYDEVKREVVAEFVADGRLTYITASLAIVRLLRLQQVLCNHYSPDPDPDAPKSPPLMIEKPTVDKKGRLVVNNPRMQDVLAVIEEARPDAKGIIWVRHHPELREIATTLRALFGDEKVVELHGKVKGDARADARHRFQDKTSPVQWLVGQIRSGIGIDLYAASWEYFYSNDYSYENRIQAEDRGHRIGQTKALTIFDAIAKGTQDAKIVDILRGKKDVAEIIVGDNPKDWI